jgi:hypothetical protein
MKNGNILFANSLYPDIDSSFGCINSFFEKIIKIVRKISEKNIAYLKN